VGIISALPPAGTFVYTGAEIKAQNFSSTYSGNLKLPTVPFMFRLSSQFVAGKNRTNIKRDMENIDTRSKQGF